MTTMRSSLLCLLLAAAAAGESPSSAGITAVPASPGGAATKTDINLTTSYHQRANTAPYARLPFAPTITFGKTPGYLAWTYGDFDGDGSVDVVAVRVNWTPEGAAVELFKGRNGSFVQDQGAFHGAPPVVVHGRKAITADFNGDGRPDALIAGHGFDKPPFRGETPTLLMNDGMSFSSSPLPIPAGFYHSVCAGDIDRDGDIDLFFTDALNGKDKTCRILINDGHGNFTYDATRFPSELRGQHYFTSELYDVDGDGNLDLVIGGHEQDGAPTRILWGSRSGAFTLQNSSELPGIPGFGIVIGFAFMPHPGTPVSDVVVNRTGDGKGGVRWYNGFCIQYLQQDALRAFGDRTDARMTNGRTETGHWITWLLVHDINRDGELDISSENPEDDLEWIQASGMFRRILRR